MANYVLLERITVGAAGASSVTFNNIPQTGYTDLKIVGSARSSVSSYSDDLVMKFNGSTANFTNKVIYNSSGSAGSASNVYSTGFISNDSAVGSTATANTFSNFEVYIPNYTSSNYKSYSVDGVGENNSTSYLSTLTAGLWSNTAAISSVTILSANGYNLTQYSTFSLYALAAVGTTPTKAPKAIGGDIIQTDGTYWYHAFLSSGSFTPQTALTCDYLVVAGGGGGGSLGGGGGAGGLRSTVTTTGGGGTPESPLALLSATAYTVTIGNGGAGFTGSGNGAGTQGTNTTFATITAVGGGAGGTNSGATSGGSGGGGGNADATVHAGTTNQGYAGGAAASASNSGGSGGGGAGGVGGNANLGTIVAGAAGGTGIYNPITDAFGALAGVGQLVSTHYYFAGGGGGSGRYDSGGSIAGGAGGNGGGGAGGASNSAGIAATPNTGGGGGGGGYNGTFYNGAAGGSGLVIVRYAY